MPLQTDAQVGPYLIEAAIGAGGMGEVYRATDTNLKRSVAIKVLPDALAGDAERLARFQREVLARLNHPNIAQVYGLQRSDAPGDRDFLALRPLEPQGGGEILVSVNWATQKRAEWRDLRPGRLAARGVSDGASAEAQETTR
jgi:serine/threonine protein kinase